MPPSARCTSGPTGSPGRARSMRLYQAIYDVLEGQVELLVGVVDEVPGQDGGRLWAGYRSGGRTP